MLDSLLATGLILGTGICVFVVGCVKHREPPRQTYKPLYQLTSNSQQVPPIPQTRPVIEEQLHTACEKSSPKIEQQIAMNLKTARNVNSPVLQDDDSTLRGVTSIPMDCVTSVIWNTERAKLDITNAYDSSSFLRF
ncbi:hypothetical protein M3Y94_00592100 [Aphelenchoides besseyi]|nr:hypothetical protein M3Y94_00592100 [Aphelenchoides besseyi]